MPDQEGQREESAGAARAAQRVVSEVAATRSLASSWARYEKAMEGVPAERREEVRRLIANLGLRPDDPEVMLLCVAGHVEAMALALHGQMDADVEAAGRALSERLSVDFEALEVRIAKRIQEMEESAMAVAEAAVGRAVQEAGKASAQALDERHGLRIEEMSEQVDEMGRRVEEQVSKSKAELFAAISKVVGAKVKAERRNSEAALAGLVEKAKWFAAGVAAGILALLLIQQFVSALR